MNQNISTTPLDVPVAPGIFGADMIDLQETGGALSCSLMEACPRAAFEKHTHPFAHLLYIIEGSGWVCFYGDGGVTINYFRKGDTLVVPPHVSHALHAGPEGTRFLAIQTPGQKLSDPDRMHTMSS